MAPTLLSMFSAILTDAFQDWDAGFSIKYCVGGKLFNIRRLQESTPSRAVDIDDEVTARTAKASVAFGRLPTNLCERNGIRLDTKLKVYKDVVLPTLFSFACETWTVHIYSNVKQRDVTIST